MTYSQVMERIGLDELSGVASEVIERLRHGESIMVTDGSEVVGELRPAPHTGSALLDRLIESGQATEPVGSILDIPPAAPAREGVSLTDDIIAERESDWR